MARLIIMITTVVIILYLSGVFPWIKSEATDVLSEIFQNLLLTFIPEYLISTNYSPDEEFDEMDMEMKEIDEDLR